MDSNQSDTQKGLLDRLRKSWFPPSAVVGAFAAFVAAAFRVGQGTRGVAPAPSRGTPKPAVQPEPLLLEREYSQSAVLHPFRNSLGGIAIGPADGIFALGDDEIRVFKPNGDFVRNFKVPQGAVCLAVGPDERVYVGVNGRVEIYDKSGDHVGGFPAGDSNRPAGVTSVKVFRNEILVADAAVRYIRRFDFHGRQIGEIGTQNKTRSFILPNGSLDMDVDSKGVVRAADSGRHRVTSWALDGSPLGYFGKFGHNNPEDFVGCCNPVNIAAGNDGTVVTAEKAVARVKVYQPGGKLLALIGPEHFDPNCTHLHLAVDSKGRILAADPVRREVKIFSPVVKIGVSEPFCRDGVYAT